MNTEPQRVYRKGWPGVWQRLIDWLYLHALISDERAAEMRWRQNNREARERGCPCGKPAIVHRDYPVTGGVPYQSWTCAEHAGADGFTRSPDGIVATYKRARQCDTCEGLCDSGGPIGGPTAYWYCPNEATP